ncbi:hypothetical protein [Thiomicrorhabdus hydrogeniphila]
MTSLAKEVLLILPGLVKMNFYRPGGYKLKITVFNPLELIE